MGYDANDITTMTEILDIFSVPSHAKEVVRCDISLHFIPAGDSVSNLLIVIDKTWFTFSFKGMLTLLLFNKYR